MGLIIGLESTRESDECQLVFQYRLRGPKASLHVLGFLVYVVCPQGAPSRGNILTYVIGPDGNIGGDRMLVYLDESYRQEGTPNCKSTSAAVCIQEDRYREFDTDLYKLKKLYWKIQSPSDLELKGRLLLSERAITLPKNREFMRQLIALMKEYSVVPFAVVQDGYLSLAMIKDRFPGIYRAILRRVDRLMEEKFSNDHAVVFFDEIDHGMNQKIAVSFNNFLFRHSSGMHFRHILPVPNFSDSSVTPGIQLADVLAYCVNERYVGRRGHLEEYFSQLRDLAFSYQNPDQGFTMWGFSMIPSGEPPDEPEQQQLI